MQELGNNRRTMPHVGRINQSVRALVAVGSAILFAIGLFVPSVSERFNTAVQWRPARPLFPPGQIRWGHSANSNLDGGQGMAPVLIDLASMNEDQLTEALTWWQHSQKIDGAPLASLHDGL